MTPNRESYRLTITPVRSGFTVPPHTRLRRLLKNLLRFYGFRLVDIDPEPTDARRAAIDDWLSR